MNIGSIILYDEPSVPEISIRSQKQFLESALSVGVEIRDGFFVGPKWHGQVAEARVSDLKRPFVRHLPSASEVREEAEKRHAGMPLYDGFELQHMASEGIPDGRDTLHVIFTDRLTGTFSDDDRRYHARAVICSNPAIISTSGIVEAPARPRRYYIETIGVSGSEAERVREKYRGQFLEYGDPRLADVIRGYLLQAVFYFETGEAFCDNRECSLYNAHWQSELLGSQNGRKKLCGRHGEMFAEFGKRH